MANKKRTDNRGRVLRVGESQRSDGRYMYRYSNEMGLRRCVYGKTLNELRKKEDEIERLKQSSVCYHEGQITVSELIERYLSIHMASRINTRVTYINHKKRVEATGFGNKKINEVKISDLKSLCIELYQNGNSYKTIGNTLAFLSIVFKMAVSEDIIVKNPCTFKLSSIIPNNKTEKQALSTEQQKRWLEYTKENDITTHHISIILLETGMRISEMLGLTLNDVNLDEGYVDINKQLNINLLKKVDNYNERCYIASPKSKKGIRKIPLTEKAYNSFIYFIKLKSCNIKLDGYSNFIFVNSKKEFYHRSTIGYHMEAGMKKYNEENPSCQIEKISPHILRHTFCTNYANSNMNLKSLQYIMGHANTVTTMEVYAHNSFQSAKDDFIKANMKIGK